MSNTKQYISNTWANMSITKQSWVIQGNTWYPVQDPNKYNTTVTRVQAYLSEYDEMQEKPSQDPHYDLATPIIENQVKMSYQQKQKSRTPNIQYTDTRQHN